MFNEHLHLTLHRAQAACYEALDIRDQSLPFWVISHVREGLVRTRTGGSSFTVMPGTVMVHPPHVPFSETADGPGTHEFLFLDAASGANVDLLRLHPVALAVPLADPKSWSCTFESLLRADAAQSMTGFGLAAQLLATVIEDWKATGAVPRPASLETPADRFAGLVQYMTAHLSERIDRDMLASRMCLHPGSFNRAFRQAYGLPPMRLLRDLRLAHARQLLESGDAVLETIAVQCGFDDLAYFSRAFRARYGLPPGRHRQQMRESVKSAVTGYSGLLRVPLPPSTMEAENTADAEGD